MTYSLLSMYTQYETSHRPGAFEIPYPVKVRSLGREIVSSKSYSWTPVLHKNFEGWVLQVTLQGYGWFQEYPIHGDNVIPLKKLSRGTGFLINPSKHQYHYWCDGNPWEFMWISLYGDFADQLCTGIVEQGHCFTLETSHEMVISLQNLLDFIREKNSIDADSLYIRGSEMLLSLNHTLCNPFIPEKGSLQMQSPKGLEQQIASYISTHVQDVTIDAIASAFGYNAKYLMNLYRKLTGHTLHTTILASKIDFATRLLTETALGIETVSEYLNFSDRFHFTKVFTKYMGCSPGVFTRKYRSPLCTKDFV